MATVFLIGPRQFITGDTIHYLAMVRGDPAPSPFAYRLMTPAIVAALPWPPARGFFLVAYAATLGTLLVMRQLFRDAGVSPAASTATASLLCFSYPLANYLGRWGRIDPRSLELEVTESVVMQDPERAISSLRELRSMGALIALDDFGTGHSSLAYLRRLPVTTIKIDRKFVSDIGPDGDQGAIVQAIIAMAHSLGMRVVAEGVESEQQLAFLSVHGCDEMQGFYFSRPLAAGAMLELLRQGSFRVHQAGL